MSRTKVIRCFSLGALFVVAALVVSACGSSSSSSSGGSSGGGGSSSSTSAGGSSSTTAGINLAAAKQQLDAVVNGSGQITLPKVGKPIPKNQTIDFITCPVAICTEVGVGVKSAAAALGWQVRTIAMNGTPAGYLSAWEQIAQNPGDGVVNTDPVLPYTSASITKLMNKANVPVTSSTSPDPVGGHLIAVTSGTAAVTQDGKDEANWVIGNAGKPVKSVFVYDPSLISIASAEPGYVNTMKANCSACSVSILKVSVAQIGPALAQQVVSYLQSNPDVKYVAFGLGDLATGVPAAIKAAGISGVTVLTRAVTPPNLQDIKNGEMAAAFTDEVYEGGWRDVDFLARSLAGVPLGNTNPLGISRLITSANLPSDITVPYSLPNYQAGFKTAWGLS
jgi:ribose transport system substrate-binding protein